MENLFVVRDEAQLKQYQEFVSRISQRLENYLLYLSREFGLGELPEAILWSDKSAAVKYISNIPVPAYTNDNRIVITPDLKAWKEIYLHQLDGLDTTAETELIKEYYSNKLCENHILQIIGHEIAHHINLFEECEYETGIWFEEGMAEYISRKFFLSAEEFCEEKKINELLIRLHSSSYGNHSIDVFGAETYSGNFASIFFEYWRAFCAVDKAISSAGDVKEVFRIYQNWLNTNCGNGLYDVLINQNCQP